MLKARKNVGKYNLGFQARECRSQTEVDAAPESEVWIRLSADVEAIGLVENVWIVVR